MIIEVQPGGNVVLREAHDLKRLSIAGVRPDAAGARRLAEAGLELTDDGGHGFMAADAVKAWAQVAGDLPEAWSADFDAMVAYAASKGWTDDQGRLRAHTEWSA